MIEVSIHYICYSVSAQMVLCAEWQGGWGPKGSLLVLVEVNVWACDRVGEEDVARFKV